MTMEVLLKDENILILRFDKGEELLSELASYCKNNGITSGYFSGLGACDEITIAYYDLENKKYLDKIIEEDLEILGISGNIAQMDGKYIIHAHGSFARKDYRAFGGHIKKLVVSATCEVHLTVLPEKIERAFDEESGLNLLK